MHDRLTILYEDDALVVIDKPRGMLSVGFPGCRGKSAEDILKEHYRHRKNVVIGAVHRLDRETSGVMLFACNTKVRDILMDNWQTLVTKRVYHCVALRLDKAALTKQRLPAALSDSGVINAPLSYNRAHKAFVASRPDPEAKPAVTRYTVLERGISADLLECELETGRKNQIRAHLAYSGHPIAGDTVYASARAMYEREGKGRRPHNNPDATPLALHACAIEFTHPITGEQCAFTADDPPFFRPLLKRSRHTTDTR